MDKIVIEPHIGIGKLKLGMKREEVHQLFGPEFETVNDEEIGIVDFYFSETIQIHYDENLQVEFIDLVYDLSNEFEVVFNGMDVFKTPANDLVNEIAKITPYDGTSELPYEYIFKEIDLELWREILPEEDDEDGLYFDTVGIGVKGYFND